VYRHELHCLALLCWCAVNSLLTHSLHRSTKGGMVQRPPVLKKFIQEGFQSLSIFTVNLLFAAKL